MSQIPVSVGSFTVDLNGHVLALPRRQSQINGNLSSRSRNHCKPSHSHKSTQTQSYLDPYTHRKNIHEFTLNPKNKPNSKNDAHKFIVPRLAGTQPSLTYDACRAFLELQGIEVRGTSVTGARRVNREMLLESTRNYYGEAVRCKSIDLCR